MRRFSLRQQILDIPVSSRAVFPCNRYPSVRTTAYELAFQHGRKYKVVRDVEVNNVIVTRIV